MSDADLYRRSSQFRMWSFTRTELEQQRTRANHRVSPSDNALTPAEELVLVRFFATDKLKQFGEVFRLPSQVRATSIAFFMRFYLQHSVMEWEPRLILPTCVFMAAKSENWFIPIDKFVEQLSGIEKQQVLDLEFMLFKALRFTLTVHSPLKPLHGFFLDMQSSSAGTPSEAVLGQIHDRARAVIVESLASDAQFLYTPSHIALAAMMEVNEDLVVQYMAQAMDGPNVSLDRLLNIVQECRTDMKAAQANKEDRKLAAKKLKAYYAQESEQPAKRLKTEPDAQ